MKPLPSLFVAGCLLITMFVGCRDRTPEKSPHQNSVLISPLLQLVDNDSTGIDFVNGVVTSDSFNILRYNYFFNGGGVAAGDINNDGLPDLFFSANQQSCRLYLNKGGMRFEDITRKAGVTTVDWASGVSMVDVNADGFLDIYVCFSGHPDPNKRRNKLFINKGDNTFVDLAPQYGLDDDSYTTQAAFFDYDLDGDLDVYLLTVYQDLKNPNLPRPKVSDGTAPHTDKLYRNNGNETFTDVSRESGILHEGFGLGVAVSDLNADGFPDLYIANDFIYDDLVYLNNGNGTFSEAGGALLKHQSRFSMGVDIRDINNDARPDIMVVDMLPEDNRRQKLMNVAMNYDLFQLSLARGYAPQYARNTLQLNNGDGTFSEIGLLAGVARTDWSWSPLFADFDNDGFADLLVTNGIPVDITDSDFIKYRDTELSREYDIQDLTARILRLAEGLPPVKKPNVIFRNNGDLTFSRKTGWGVNLPTFSNGAAYADLDLDGDLDLVVNNINDHPCVLRNEARDRYQHSFVRVKFAGPEMNPNGIGASVTLSTKTGVQFQENYPVRGFQSAVDHHLHFGVADPASPVELTVKWPGGRCQVMASVPPGQTVTVDYREAGDCDTGGDRRLPPVMEDVAAEYGVRHRHKENEFVDFKHDPLLPHMYSRNGPGIAVGDLNGDGLDDFVIGGAVDAATTLYFQNEQGGFRARPLKAGLKYEDMGVLIFDANNDGHADLYIVSGGSEYNAHTVTYQDRLFMGDGKGGFTPEPDRLPVMTASGGCVTAADYDQDGDVDLFIGGRVVPGNYPLAPRSYLLRNDGGFFKDVTEETCRSLAHIGMVTAAQWTDFDNDMDPDLVLVGEWMPVTFLKNDGGQFTPIQAQGLERSEGWWNSVTAADFDNDGDMDYVAGNLGLNSLLRADAAPVKVFAKDFDANGKLDPVLGYPVEGVVVPYHARDAMVEQVPAWRRRFPDYASYATATMESILQGEAPGTVKVLDAHELRTIYIENRGGGNFRVVPLPVETQVSPVFGLHAADLDADGNMDLLMTGNAFATEYVQGHYDAFTGLVMMGKGDGTFAVRTSHTSGFRVEGDGKALAALTDGRKRAVFLAAQNNGFVKLFRSAFPMGTTLSLDPGDVSVLLTRTDGSVQRREFYRGGGYLSQSSRAFFIDPSVRRVQVFNYAGAVRLDKAVGVDAKVEAAVRASP